MSMMCAGFIFRGCSAWFGKPAKLIALCASARSMPFQKAKPNCLTLLTGYCGLAHGAILKLLGYGMRSFLMAAIAAVAVCVGANRASAGVVINDQTTCMKIVGYSMSEDDIPALQRAIGKYAAAIFTHYGVPAPKNLQDFGMNVSIECVGLPPRTSVLEVANKVRGYWRD